MSRRLAGILAASLLAASCGPARSASANGEIIVLAAASLTEAFTEIAGGFEAANPEALVRLSFGPSDGLAAQIREGAPADVFASASERWMEDVAERGPGVAIRADFARNELVLITPADDPAAIGGLEDLARPGIRLVLAAEGVPAGDYAREILRNAGVADAALANLASNEEDVKAVVQKVALGEADAGVVYRTDVTEAVAADLRAIEIQDAFNVVAAYPIAVLADSEQPDLATAFVDFVLGEGATTLGRFGFLPAG